MPDESKQQPSANTNTANKIDKKINLEFLQRVSMKEKMFFIQNLKTMVKAGMSLTESLQSLSSQTENPLLKKILADMVVEIEKGNTLSTSMNKYPKVFSKIFVNMISAGEASGNLENILDQLYIQIKKDYELISKIKGAMTYPIVIICAMLVMVTGMMFFVFPTFISLFKEAGVELPLITRILIGISEFIINKWPIVLIIIISFSVGLVKFIKTDLGRRWFDLFLLKIFIIGPVTKKINLARFARSISSLLATDIPIMKSFEITASVVDNIHYQEAIMISIEKIKKGATISETIGAYPNLFPPMIVQMMAVGEKSGTTDRVLAEIANFYEDEVETTTKNLSSIIEPFLILLIGGAVGIVAVAVMMPMYNLAQAI